jgi:hypothetical protein
MATVESNVCPKPPPGVTGHVWRLDGTCAFCGAAQKHAAEGETQSSAAETPELMAPLTVTIVAVRPAKNGEQYVGINLAYGIAAVDTWLDAHRDTPGPVLIVSELPEPD